MPPEPSSTVAQSRAMVFRQVRSSVDDVPSGGAIAEQVSVCGDRPRSGRTTRSNSICLLIPSRLGRFRIMIRVRAKVDLQASQAIQTFSQIAAEGDCDVWGRVGHDGPESSSRGEDGFGEADEGVRAALLWRPVLELRPHRNIGLFEEQLGFGSHECSPEWLPNCGFELAFKDEHAIVVERHGVPDGIEGRKEIGGGFAVDQACSCAGPY